MERRAANAAEAMFLEKWYGITANDAERLLLTAGRLSDSELLERPLLVTGALIAVQLRSSQGGADNADGLERFANLVLQSPDHDIGNRLPSQRVRQWRVMQMVAKRWRRDYAGARELSDFLSVNSPASSVKELLFTPHANGLWPGHLSLQRGLTEALAGTSSSAMECFTRAYDEGGAPPYAHFARANAASNAAMLAAIEGNAELAESWIERSYAAGPVPDWVTHLTHVGREIAAAQLAIDDARLEDAARILTGVGAAGESIELWPFLLHVTVSLQLASGHAVAAYEHLKGAGFQRNRVTANDAVADHLVFRSYLDTLIATGEGGIVLRLADDLGHPLRSLVPVARTRLMSGDFASAARVASHALRRAELPVRDMWEATWVHALAALAAGNREIALRSYEIVRAGRPRTLTAMINRSPHDLVAALYAAAGDPPPSGFSAQQHTTIEVPNLTARESHILQLLAENLSPRAIAEREVSSEHTVRTHIKRIYRKLEVSNRQDAVTRAEHLGLLRWFHLDGENHAL